MSGPAQAQLVDRFGRVHRDLRISLTDRCSLRCTYCMPAEGVPWLARDTMLSTEEIVRVARVGVELGITEIRLTGGEPLLRTDVVDVVRRLAALTGPEGSPEVSLDHQRAAPARPGRTAAGRRAGAGQHQPRHARPRRGSRSSPVATGSSRPSPGWPPPRPPGSRRSRSTRSPCAGSTTTRSSTLARWAVDHGYQMRFIEQMPLDAGHTWDRVTMVTQAEILERLTSAFTLTEVPGRGAAPAEPGPSTAARRPSGSSPR